MSRREREQENGGRKRRVAKWDTHIHIHAERLYMYVWTLREMSHKCTRCWRGRQPLFAIPSAIGLKSADCCTARRRDRHRAPPPSFRPFFFYSLPVLCQQRLFGFVAQPFIVCSLSLSLCDTHSSHNSAGRPRHRPNLTARCLGAASQLISFPFSLQLNRRVSLSRVQFGDFDFWQTFPAQS